MLNKEWYKDFDKNNYIFEKLDIDINGDDVSDIILKNENKRLVYTNCRTKRQSKNIKNVISGRNFLVLDENEWDLEHYPYHKTACGYYLKHIKELDMLVIITCSLAAFGGDITNCKWMEKDRLFIAKNGRKFGTIEDCALYEDICGQSTTDLYDVWANQPVGAKKALLSFCNGLFFKDVDTIFFMMFDYNKNDRIFNILMSMFKYIHTKVHYDEICECFKESYNLDSAKNVFFGGVAVYDADGLKKKYNSLPIPEEAEENMQIVTRKWLEERMCTKLPYKDCSLSKKDAYTLSSLSFLDIVQELSFIQNIDGCMVERCFCPIFLLGYDKESCDIVLVEYLDVYLDAAKEQSFEYIKSAMRTFPVWIEGNLKGTMFEYTGYIIKEFIDALFERLNKLNFSAACFGLSRIMEDKYGVEAKAIVTLAMEISTNKVIEKLFNMNKYNDNVKHVIRRILNRITITESYNSLKNYFGEIDESKEKLHENLMLPKGLFEFMASNDMFDDIYYLKMAFWTSNEAKKYFLKMNRESYKYLALSPKNAGLNENRRTNYWMVLKELICLYGVKKWRSYVAHMNKILEDRDTMHWRAYYDYINLLDDINEALEDKSIIKHAQWKLKGEALHKAFESMQEVSKVMEYGDYNEMVNRFNEQQKEWQKYCFEKEDLLITAPKRPQDLINEGVKLKNCAKEFIPVCASGQTMLLFIRKKEEPDKPYYTLEIKGGEVRQCHGMSNCTISDNEKLISFLKNFCENKGVKYAIGDKALGIHDDN